MTSAMHAIAEEFANLTTHSFFLTGKAGTGKTTFLRLLKDSSRKQLAIVAPTGVAAIHAGGVTIHSFFQLPFTPFVPTPEGRLNLIQKHKMTRRKRKVLQELELLVVDEISMVRADVLDEIDTILRHYRYRHNEPFGGVQVILIGDLYQLAPVAVAEEWHVLAPYYATPYFFHSRVIQENPLPYIEFDKIFRQNDETFIRILNEVRNDCLSEQSFQRLQQRCVPDFDISKHPDHILLTTHNAKADSVNSQELERLSAKEYCYDSIIKGEFPEKSLPNSTQLHLKEGARVMFIANDTEFPRRYYNGKIGTVDFASRDQILVRCDDDDTIVEVGREVWKNIRYRVHPTTKQIEEEELGSFQQYPLRLAWAITVHKSQGLTFEKVAIDLEQAFTSGQVYVALSRCRSLEGISLLSQINRSSLSIDCNVVAFSASKTDTAALHQMLEDDKARYNQDVVCSIFSFTFCYGLCQQLRSMFNDEKDLFYGKVAAFLNTLDKELASLNGVGGRFQHQLRKLYQEEDKEVLSDRVRAASVYFTKELDRVTGLMREAPSVGYDIELSDEYQFSLQSLYDELMQKRHIISHIDKDFSTRHCLELKNEYTSTSLKRAESAKRSEKKMATNRVKSSKTTPKKEEKGPNTFEQTLILFKKGKNIPAIAEERGLAVSTIEGHLARFVEKGELSAFKFVTKRLYKAVQKIAQEELTNKEIVESFEGKLTYGQLRFIQAGMAYEAQLKKSENQ